VASEVDVITIPELTEGIETHGIERVSPTARAHVRIFDNFTMWLSANLVISTVATGALSPIFKLGFWDSAIAIILFNILGVLPVAFFSTLGPKLGLRQMTISRFSFGWIGAMIMAIFNILACIGWSAVNVIVGGQLVASLSNGAVPFWVGILIIAALTTTVSIYGYKYIHRYERFAWIPMVIIFVILAIVAGPHFSIVPTPVLNMAWFAGFISYSGAIYGFATGWSSYAADYNVNQPEETPASRVFWLTFLGVTIPCVLLELLGLALSAHFYGDSGLEWGVIVQPLGGFGTALLVLLALSVVANNIPNDYSLGLSVQVLGKAFQKVKRAVWTLIGAVVYVIIAIPLAAHFSETLTSFLLLMAYWLGPWSIILILEHFVFRKGKYNVEEWNMLSKLPIGWAAIVSAAIGLVGVWLGGSQTWIINGNFIPVTGLLAARIGGGGDIGFELGIIFAGIAYLILRRVELKNSGR
jgi:NCS1 nucleoside transporter family